MRMISPPKSLFLSQISTSASNSLLVIVISLQHHQESAKFAVPFLCLTIGLGFSRAIFGEVQLFGLRTGPLSRKCLIVCVGQIILVPITLGVAGYLVTNQVAWLIVLPAASVGGVQDFLRFSCMRNSDYGRLLASDALWPVNFFLLTLFLKVSASQTFLIWAGCGSVAILTLLFTQKPPEYTPIAWTEFRSHSAKYWSSMLTDFAMSRGVAEVQIILLSILSTLAAANYRLAQTFVGIGLTLFASMRLVALNKWNRNELTTDDFQTSTKKKSLLIFVIGACVGLAAHLFGQNWGLAVIGLCLAAIFDNSFSIRMLVRRLQLLNHALIKLRIKYSLGVLIGFAACVAFLPATTVPLLAALAGSIVGTLLVWRGR